MILSHCSSANVDKISIASWHTSTDSSRQTDIKSSRINRPARAPKDAITNKWQKYMNASPPLGFIMSRGTTQGVIFTRANAALPSSDGLWIHNDGVTWNRPPSFPQHIPHAFMCMKHPQRHTHYNTSLAITRALMSTLPHLPSA